VDWPLSSVLDWKNSNVPFTTTVNTHPSHSERTLISETWDGESWPRFFVVSFGPLQAKAWIFYSFDDHNLFPNPFEVKIHLTLSSATVMCSTVRYQKHRSNYHRLFYTTMMPVPYLLWNGISVESILDSWRWDRQFVPKRRQEITTKRYVITQKSAFLIYFTAEAWYHACLYLVINKYGRDTRAVRVSQFIPTERIFALNWQEWVQLVMVIAVVCSTWVSDQLRGEHKKARLGWYMMLLQH
jgi:hypothetical protein